MAKQITADEESILKRQARRRLIGAIALTTAVVIILPVVFDGEPPATKAGDIELRIPDKDKSIDVPLRSTPSVTNAASSVAVASSAVSVASAVAPPTAVVAPIPVVKSALPQNTQEGKIEHPKPEHKSDQKAAVSHNSVPHSGFVVQVGAFSNLDTAKNCKKN